MDMDKEKDFTNKLVIRSDGCGASIGDVLLNGKPLVVKWMRIDIPEGPNTPLIRVTTEFYAEIDIEAVLNSAKVTSDGVFVMNS